MPSTFTRLPLRSGSGNRQDDGHRDMVVEVLQEDNGKNRLDVATELDNPFSYAQAKGEAGSPAGMTLDRHRADQFNDIPYAIKWTFLFSNNGLYSLGTLGDNVDAVVQSTFNQTEQNIKRDLPAVLQNGSVKILGGPIGVPVDLPVYHKVTLDNSDPEVLLLWQVKAIAPFWNPNVAGDIARRRGSIHNINGNIFKFGGVRGVRRQPNGDGKYEVTYQWIIDPGTEVRSVSSDQDTDNKLILPSVIQEGDPALTLPGGLSMEGGLYIRLPYHDIAHGQTDTPLVPPPFIQVKTATFNPSRYDDWMLLPGEPVPVS